jgi:hypothetical protein
MPCPDWAFPQPCRLFIPYVDDLPYAEHEGTICQPLGGSKPENGNFKIRANASANPQLLNKRCHRFGSGAYWVLSQL